MAQILDTGAATHFLSLLGILQAIPQGQARFLRVLPEAESWAVAVSNRKQAAVGL